ncbi:O-antigen ligase family protein, partial [Candidatus Omnitrophota bacterium]
ALVVTFSRTALIGLAGVLLVAVVKAKNKFLGIILGVICVIAAFNLLPDYTWERFSGTQIAEKYTGNADIDSTTIRYHLAQTAWRTFLHNPIFGVGVGNYYWEGRRYGPVPPERAHCLYLEFLAELGIVGFFLFCGMLFHVAARQFELNENKFRFRVLRERNFYRIRRIPRSGNISSCTTG